MRALIVVFILLISSAHLTQAASDLVTSNKLLGRDYMFFGSMCFSYSEAEPTSPDTFKCRRSTDTLYVDGLIEEAMFDEMVLWGGDNYRFVGQLPLKKVHLNSKGGLMFDHSGVAATAVDIINLIKEKEIETFAGVECKSACVPIFASGEKRLAFKKTDFMVHSPRLGGGHTLFLKEKCGELLDDPLCADELDEIRQIQVNDMGLYFDLIEREGVSSKLREDYLKGGPDLKAPGNGNLLGIEDLYFNGVEAFNYGLALGLRN